MLSLLAYPFFALALYLVGRCLWEIYLYFYDRSSFERMRAHIEDHEGEVRDIEHPIYLFIAYPFLIGGCFLIGFLLYIS